MPEQSASSPKGEEISLRLMHLLQARPDLNQPEFAKKFGMLEPDELQVDDLRKQTQ